MLGCIFPTTKSASLQTTEIKRGLNNAPLSNIRFKGEDHTQARKMFIASDIGFDTANRVMNEVNNVLQSYQTTFHQVLEWMGVSCACKLK